MRLAVFSTILAILALPMGAMACENCVYHGTAQEYAAWSAILATGSPSAATARTPSRSAASRKDVTINQRQKVAAFAPRQDRERAPQRGNGPRVRK